MTSPVQRSPAAPEAPEVDDDVVDGLRESIAALSEGKLGAAEIDPDGHLFDYGYLSSLTAVMFLAGIEDRWGVEIEDLELVEEVTTLNAVAGRIRERR